MLVTVCFLLILHLNSSLFLTQEPLYVIETKDKPAVLKITCRDEIANITFYRLNQDKSQLVSNYTFRYTVQNITSEYYLIYFSENEEYFSECWKNGLLMEKTHFHVIFCAQREETRRMSFLHGDTAEISCQKFNSSRGETFQVFQSLRTAHLSWTSTKILDTSVSLEIIPDSLRSRMEVLNDGSLIRFSNISVVDSGIYTCLSWSENQCQNYKQIELDIKKQDIFLVPGESVTLPCVIKDSTLETLLWITPIGFRFFGKIEEYGRYEILNGTQTGNYSLFIPHLFLNHTGLYICTTESKMVNELNIFVCSNLEPIKMTFSLGDSADLMCAFNRTESLRVQWYREYNQSSKHLLVDTQGAFVNEDMTERLNASNPNYITISELLIRDGGSYWCRAWGMNDNFGGLCFNRRVQLTYMTPHFYIVYASLMGFVLLCIISAVVFVKVVRRNRRTQDYHN